MKPSEMVQAVTSALLALVSVVGAFALVFYDTVNGHPVALPDFVSLLIGAVIGSYLTHAATVNGARQAGTAAAQTAINAAAEGHIDATSIPKVP